MYRRFLEVKAYIVRDNGHALDTAALQYCHALCDSLHATRWLKRAYEPTVFVGYSIGPGNATLRTRRYLHHPTLYNMVFNGERPKLPSVCTLPIPTTDPFETNSTTKQKAKTFSTIWKLYLTLNTSVVGYARAKHKKKHTKNLKVHSNASSAYENTKKLEGAQQRE